MLPDPLRSWLRTIYLNRRGALLLLLSTVVGGSALFLCLSYVVHVYSFDRWDPDLKRTLRIQTTIVAPNGAPIVTATSARSLAPWLRSLKLQGIESITSILQRPITIATGAYRYKVNGTFVDPYFLETLPLQWETPPIRKLAANQVLISSRLASSLFPGADPIGMGVRMDPTNRDQFTIAGVFNLPSATHFDFNVIALNEASTLLDSRRREDWLSLGAYTYVKTQPDFDLSSLTYALEHRLDDYVEPMFYSGSRLLPSSLFQFRLVAVPKIYLHSNAQGEQLPPGNLKATELLKILVFGISVVLVANIANQTLLITLTRSKESAIRRLVGQSGVGQFLETFIILWLLCFMMLILTWGCSLFVATEVTNHLNLGSGWQWSRSLLGVLPASGFAGILAIPCALVPSLALSKSGTRGLTRFEMPSLVGVGGVRLILFAIQIALCSVVAFTAVLAGRQLVKLESVDPGFNIEHKVTVKDVWGSGQPLVGSKTLWQELVRLPQVRSVAFVSDLPGEQFRQARSISLVGANQEMSTKVQFLAYSGSINEVLSLRLLVGRALTTDLDSQVGADAGNLNRKGILINDMLREQLGFARASDAIGKELQFNDGRSIVTIAGVVPNILYAGVRRIPEPLIIGIDERRVRHVLVHVEANADARTSDRIGAIVRQVIPNSEIEVDGLRTIWVQQFASIRILSNLSFLLLTCTAVLIVSGVASLVALSVRARAKHSSLLILHGASWFESAKITLRSIWLTCLLATCLGSFWAANLLLYLDASVLFAESAWRYGTLSAAAIIFFVFVSSLIVHGFESRWISPVLLLKAT